MDNAEKTGAEVSNLCSQLVQFNTAHPQGRTDEIVEHIAGYFEDKGVKWETHSNNPLKPNIVAKIKGTSKKKILWVGHLDVVPEGKIENWNYPPYGGEITKDGLIYGRGASDMKGACAAAMVSARILSDLNEKIENSVEFWFTADEEIGGRDGARWLAQTNRLKGDVCIIGDGNNGGTEAPSIDLGCKGSARTRLIARGKTAHGSVPFMGENAINKLLRVIPWVEKIKDYALDLPPELDEPIQNSIEFILKTQSLTEEQKKEAERVFNYPTVTCNIIEGGVKVNVVPDYAEALFDIRLTPGSNPLKVKEKILELVAKSNVQGVEAQVNAGNRAGYYESPDTEFAKQLLGLLHRITGKKPTFNILTGGTDAVSIKRYSGIPCLGYGTSMTGQAHKPNEYNTTDNLMLGVKVYTGFPLIYKA
jgi:succinyl-diaminopimelate desuccinylase